MDGLVTLLTATQNQQSAPEHSLATIDRMDIPTPQLATMSSLRNTSQQAPVIDFSQPTIPDTLPLHSSRPERGDIYPGASVLSSIREAQIPTTPLKACEPTPAEANNLLQRFRDEMTPCFPFIVVSPSMTAEQLSQERPFLYACIIAVSSLDPSQQTQIGKLIMKQLADRMIVKSQRNLELLLGILTYAG